MAAADAAQCLQDPNAFEALVGSLLQADNTARKHAEAVFDEVKKHPDGCVSHLMRCLRQSPSEEHRAFSAIMLRKVLTRDEPTMYQASSPQVQVGACAGRRARPPAAAAAPPVHRFYACIVFSPLWARRLAGRRPESRQVAPGLIAQLCGACLIAQRMAPNRPPPACVQTGLCLKTLVRARPAHPLPPGDREAGAAGGAGCRAERQRAQEGRGHCQRAGL